MTEVEQIGNTERRRGAIDPVSLQWEGDKRPPHRAHFSKLNRRLTCDSAVSLLGSGNQCIHERRKKGCVSSLFLIAPNGKWSKYPSTERITLHYVHTVQLLTHAAIHTKFNNIKLNKVSQIQNSSCYMILIQSSLKTGKTKRRWQMSGQWFPVELGKGTRSF